MAEAPKQPVNWDYSRFPGGNMVGGDNDPFAGEPPSSDREYGIYRQHYEDKMRDALAGSSFLKFGVTCEDTAPDGTPILLHQVKKNHLGSSFVLCCAHVLHQDPKHPDGIWMVPLDLQKNWVYYLCPTCVLLLRRWKLNLDNIHPKCASCVGEMISAIAVEHPDAFHIEGV